MTARNSRACPFLLHHNKQVPEWHECSLLSSRRDETSPGPHCAEGWFFEQLGMLWPEAFPTISHEGAAFIRLCAGDGRTVDECVATWGSYVRAIKLAAASHPSSRFNGHVTIAALSMYSDLDPDYAEVRRHLNRAWACGPVFIRSKDEHSAYAARNVRAALSSA